MSLKIIFRFLKLKNIVRYPILSYCNNDKKSNSTHRSNIFFYVLYFEMTNRLEKYDRESIFKKVKLVLASTKKLARQTISALSSKRKGTHERTFNHTQFSYPRKTFPATTAGFFMRQLSMIRSNINFYFAAVF